MARAAKSAEPAHSPDAIEGVPLPREQTELIGHKQAERRLLDAYRSGRMHHGWLFTGEHGIGKATLAFRLARFVLAHPDPTAAEVLQAEDLSLSAEHPVSRMVALGTHCDLLHLQREWDDKAKRFRAGLSVDTVRRTNRFLGTTSGEGGWRIAIVDPADDMTTSAANALLKNLEEPPRRTLFLLLAQSAGTLPPTIRSRCRMLHLRRLSDSDTEAVLARLGVAPLPAADRRVSLTLAGGRPRKLIEASRGDATSLYRLLRRALEAGDAEAQLKLSAAASDGYEQVFDLLLGYLHRRVRSDPEPTDAAAPELPLVTWAELWEKATQSGLEVEAYNLDRRQFLLDILETVAAAIRRPGMHALR